MGKITKEEMLARDRNFNRDHHSGGKNGGIVGRVGPAMLPNEFKKNDNTAQPVDTRQQVINSNNALTE